ncbi:hypothetical protein ALC57_03236 [Trachymyrmex cornetzi]|uniref:Uncharacterized protein n=1 Tax=Trachymyrmex cornetzi TaxID=471704 RepID=A0A151JM15_9HYME|nr:hypothetical protein ALC57_03236 [Trachymyrmex cornetzi]
MLVGCLGSITAADVIFCRIQEYKPQPRRINYVSSVIRLMLVYTERLLRYFVLYLAWLASTSPCARIVSRGSIETSSETFKFGDPRLIARADREWPATLQSLGYHTRDIVPFQRTFNSRDSNLYHAAVWIVPFREDYVNIYTASEIPGDFPTAPIPYIPFLAMDRGFYRDGKLLNKPKRNSDDVSSGRNAIAIYTYCLPTTVYTGDMGGPYGKGKLVSRRSK